MSLHAYPRARFLAAVVGQDAVLFLAIAFGLVSAPSPLARSLLVAATFALAWSLVTLHFPSVVSLDPDAVTFRRYGRVHRFAWKNVARLRVRRFLVTDRVLVRITPSPPWRGRYWILESIAGYDALVRALEERGGAGAREAPR